MPQTRRVRTPAPEPRACTQWLVAAHPDPGRVERAWHENGIALLPAGRCFDAVKLLAASRDTDLVRGALAVAGVDGLVWHDPASGAYYLLMPPGTAADWAAPDSVGLGKACFLGVPAPSHTSGYRSHWLIPPTTGRLTDPAALRQALHADPRSVLRRHEAEP